MQQKTSISKGKQIWWPEKKKEKIVGGESIDLFKEKVIIILKGKKFTILDRFNFK